VQILNNLIKDECGKKELTEMIDRECSKNCSSTATILV
jgi:hypothetical protein